MRAIAADRHYIHSDSGLRAAADQWRKAPALGIDTEFIRVDTFHPQPALVQVSDGRECWLVDVLDVKDFAPLAGILTEPQITKIVHAAGEDLEVFDRLVGALPQPLFDTQIAAAFCGHGPSIGYSRLVQGVLGVELSKDQCRSDWLARPLTDEQQHYACLDVLYLPALYEHLGGVLAQRQRIDWSAEENLRQLARYREQRESPYNIERITNAWRLGDSERQRLWHLLLGRDALARAHNKPRNHIARDFALFDMARRPPKHVAELSAIDGLRPSGIRQFGSELIRLAQEVPPDLLVPPLFEPLGRLENNRVKELRGVTEQVAAAQDLPTELLVRKQELESLVRQHASASAIMLPERFNGWREPVIARPLRDCIHSWS